jgi:hypothetical protein
MAPMMSPKSRMQSNRTRLMPESAYRRQQPAKVFLPDASL